MPSAWHSPEKKLPARNHNKQKQRPEQWPNFQEFQLLCRLITNSLKHLSIYPPARSLPACAVLNLNQGLLVPRTARLASILLLLESPLIGKPGGRVDHDVVAALETKACAAAAVRVEYLHLQHHYSHDRNHHDSSCCLEPSAEARHEAQRSRVLLRLYLSRLTPGVRTRRTGFAK